MTAGFPVFFLINSLEIIEVLDGAHSLPAVERYDPNIEELEHAASLGGHHRK